MVKAILPPPGLQRGEPLYPGPELRARVPGPSPGSTRPAAGARGAMETSSSLLWAHPATRTAATERTKNHTLKSMTYGAGEERLRESDLEDGSHVDLALDGDAAAVHLYYLLAYGEPQSASSRRTRAVLVHPVEPLEELVQIFFGDADARVTDAHGQRRVVLLYLHVHPGAGVGVLDRVVQQIEEDLVELLDVADALVLAGVTEVDPDAEPLGFGLYRLYGSLDDRTHVGRPYLELVLPGVHLGEGQQLLDHPPDALQFLICQFQRPVLQRVEPVACPLQQADRALDGGEGGPELVREIRDEGRLGLLERAVLGYVPYGQDDAGVPASVVRDAGLPPVHLGGVSPVSLL